jgi:hypothetical protein
MASFDTDGDASRCVEASKLDFDIRTIRINGKVPNDPAYPLSFSE